MSTVDLPIHQDLHALYSDNHNWLFHWLRRRLKNLPEAADIAHDTFVRVFVSGRVPDVAHSRQYLTQIANGLVIDWWRRQDIERAYVDAISALPEPEVPSEEARLLIIESLTIIDRLLSRLPAFTRRVFLMAQLDGFTLHEIGEATATPVITVRRHIRKALIACMEAA